jgi:hypothetical protein
MIAIHQSDAEYSSDWQVGFMTLLPEIKQRLHQAFRRRDAAAREEAITDAIVLCLLSYVRLHEQGRADKVTASNLAWYAAKQVKTGRSVGCRLNSKEPLAVYAQQRRGIRVEHLRANNPDDHEWIDSLVQDQRSTVLDHVAAKLDVAAWLKTLCRRTRRIATDLAKGSTTSEVARKYGVTAARISQLRQELKNSWGEFQHEPAFAT